jgi:Arc/MetJ-type ribon-helix-helix transcriptional regulator
VFTGLRKVSNSRRLILIRLITVYLTEFDIKQLDTLVKQGFYPNRAEAIRLAVHELVRTELDIEEKLGKIKVDIKETGLTILENGNTFQVEIMRDRDNSIWGVYPEKPNNDTCVFADGMRNIILLIRKGVLKLQDFPRKVAKKEAE